MITGAHSIIYSTDPDADRAFFRDILQFPQVESGSDWLIFELPPAELAVHPADRNNIHEIYLKCDNIKDAVRTKYSLQPGRGDALGIPGPDPVTGRR